jgi:hypothetical protein
MLFNHLGILVTRCRKVSVPIIDPTEYRLYPNQPVVQRLKMDEVRVAWYKKPSDPGLIPVASHSFLPTRSQWLNWPSGPSVARNRWPLIAPSTVVLPRRGSFSHTSFGSTANAHEGSPPGCAAYTRHIMAKGIGLQRGTALEQA